MFVLAFAMVLALALAPAASAQNGFPVAKAANHQYEPHPPSDPGNGNGNGPPAGKPPQNPGKPKSGSGGNAKNKVGAGVKPDSADGRRGVLGAGTGGADRNGLPLATARGGRLPFTGLDLLMLSSLGALLLAAGFGIRAVTRVRANRS